MNIAAAFGRWLKRSSKHSVTVCSRRRTPLDMSALGAFFIEEQLPRVRWDIVHAYVSETTTEFTPHEYYCDATEQWLTRLAKSLGTRFQVLEAPGCFLLSSRSDTENLIDFCERARIEIDARLGRAAWQNTTGKKVVIILDSPDSYYSYISPFYPQKGRFGLSGGVCLKRDYVHIVLQAQQEDCRGTIVHELVHNALAHRQKPQWLEEGLAQVLARQITGSSRPLHGHRAARCQRRFWSRYGLEAFWSGRCFTSDSGVQRLGYELADLMIMNLGERHKRQFVDFLDAAEARDAGHAAALLTLRIGVGELAAELLGPGNWEPRTLLSGQPAPM